MAIAPRRLRRLSAGSSEIAFLSGFFTDTLLPGAERAYAPGRGLPEIKANLSDDCGTYYMGCPNATHSNDCYTAAEGSAPSCCLCNTNEGNCGVSDGCGPSPTDLGCPAPTTSDDTCPYCPVGPTDSGCAPPENDSSDGTCYSNDSSDGTCHSG